MATTSVAAASQAQVWDRRFFSEYVRDHAFEPFMGGAIGEGSMMPILVHAQDSLGDGNRYLNVPFIEKLEGSGVRDEEQLDGTEEALGNFNQQFTVNWNRHAFKVSRQQEGWTAMDLRNAGKMALKTWAAEKLRDDLIVALWAFSGDCWLKGKVATSGTGASTPAQWYAAIAEATKDAWLAANTDRYLFGNAVSNHSANDHSTALGNIDTTADRLTSGHVSLAKMVARTADRKIRPVKQSVSAGRDDYVYFVGSRGFRDLKTDTAIVAANRDARTRGIDNPLFQDGDLIWDGVVIREIPEIPVLTGVGGSTSDVQPGFFCGAQAVAMLWGQKPRTKPSAEDDYGFFHKLAIEECRATAKLVYNGVQHGMVNTYYSAPATA